MAGKDAEVRLMVPDDVEAAHATASLALADSPEERERMLGRKPEETAAQTARYHHLLATDAPGAWVAVDGDRVVGVALSLVREHLWGLSLLAVDGAYQGLGLGREMLRRALDYGRGCRAWITVSSTHPAAMRSYALAGLTLQPTLRATGRPRVDLAESETVREGSGLDLDLTQEVDRHVRGVPHAGDISMMLETGASLLVADDGQGYAVHRDGTPALLAAKDENAAKDLLRACLSGAQGREAEVMWISARQDWAVPVVLEAGLDLQPSGCVCASGDLGPLRPYLPNGAYL